MLVHITHGPEAPTRVALGFLVAKTAVESGHQVTLFLAGDAVFLLKDEVIASLSGLGTGSLSEHFSELVAADVPILVSAMSSKKRGITEEDLAVKGAKFAWPADLVEQTFAADRVLTY
ncbi:MAG: DsrE family protein [Acidimicrobiia bacterium]